MFFRVIDRRICDYFDYEHLARTIKQGQSKVLENNGNNYVIEWVKMSPKKYIEECAKMFGTSIARLIESRDDDALKQLRNNISAGNYGIIYIDIPNKMQDGLHRAIILAEKGVSSINVLTIKKSARTNDSGGLIKGIIFDSKENITTAPFDNFYGEGYVKLGGNTYMLFWHNGTSHQSKELEISNKYDINNVEYYAISEVNGILDLYDLNNLRHSAYRDKLIAKAKKYFGTY